MKKAIRTEAAPAAIGPYSQAICADKLIFVSGQIPLEPLTGQLVDGDVVDQTRQVLNNIQAILQAAGSSMSGVVKTTVFLADLGDFGRMNEVYATYFPAQPPARATVQVARLPRDVRVEIEAIALAD